MLLDLADVAIDQVLQLFLGTQLALESGQFGLVLLDGRYTVPQVQMLALLAQKALVGTVSGVADTRYVAIVGGVSGTGISPEKLLYQKH